MGKTNFAVNLAIGLSRRRRRVVLIDGDLGLANADVLCNLRPHFTLAHVIAGTHSLDQIITPAPGGFELIPGASGVGRLAALGEFERARLIGSLEELGRYSDVMILDCPAGISPTVISLASAAERAVVVTTPEPTALTDAYAMIKVLWQQRSGVAIDLLVNQVSGGAEAEAVGRRLVGVAEKFLDCPVGRLGYVCRDPNIPAAVRARRPVMIASPRCPAAACIDRAAEALIRQTAPATGRQGFFSRVAGLLARGGGR